MKLYKILMTITMLLTSSAAFSDLSNKYYPASFALDCQNTSHALNLLPLGLYEFKDDIEYEIGKNPLSENLKELLFKIAPLTFKNFKKEFQNIKISMVEFNLPVLDRYDPLVSPPVDCQVITMVQTMDSNNQKMTVNKKYWDSLPLIYQQYFLFEVLVQKYLASNLSSVDYRRFSVYIGTEIFNKMSDDQQIYFLKYHGVNEYLYSHISIDLSRDIIFFDDSKIIKDAFPYLGALFEGAILDQRKFVSFTKNKKIFELATTTSFARTINGQSFNFIVPPSAVATSYPFDIRFNPRTRLFSNGNIQFSYILPVKNFYQFKKMIGPSSGFSKSFYEVSFFENQSPSGISSDPGEVEVFGKVYLSDISYWWENGNLKELYLNQRHRFTLADGKIIDAQILFFDKEGKINRYY